MSDFRDLFGDRKVLIGMVHLGPLPGSARASGRFDEVLRRAVEDSRALYEGGIHTIMVENFFDAPFAKTTVPPVTISAMTAAVLAVREAVPVPVGVNVLRNDIVAALSIAHVTGARFARCNVYVGAMVADQGIIEGAAREAILTRKALGAGVQIWADIQVKHAMPLADSTLAGDARDAAERGLADALIVSGHVTGSPVDFRAVQEVKEAVPATPVLIGSGFEAGNAAELLRFADGAIVGTSLKRGGRIDAPVDRDRVAALVGEISR